MYQDEKFYKSNSKFKEGKEANFLISTLEVEFYAINKYVADHCDTMSYSDILNCKRRMTDILDCVEIVAEFKDHCCSECGKWEQMSYTLYDTFRYLLK